MTTAFISHSDCLLHEMGSHHPERPERLRAIERALEKESFSTLLRLSAPRATKANLLHAHPPSYIDWFEQNAPLFGTLAVDGDTSMNASSWDAALRASGGAVLGVDEVFGGHVRNAFVSTRPPGHHVERKKAMGFCFLSNAVIAARHAQKAHGAERVAIVDFDVHHGNGTQDILWDDKSIFFASTHEMPLFPGTGALSETGAHNQIFNAPLRSGDGGEEFMEAYTSRILPALKNFNPDFLVISAGFDGHFKDPLANLNLTPHDFSEVTKRLIEHCPRAVSVLEGGYDLDGLATSAAAHIKALMG
jgi:acetoin utilization deacetylase AcuC-like enzyme